MWRQSVAGRIPRNPAENAAVTSRTIETVVHFASAFSFAGIAGQQPAGAYRVDRDEELIESVSRVAWPRTKTFFHLPAIDTPGPKQQMVPINPADLEAALERDRQS
nr:hypothetical protein [Aminobacter sp. MDW-2]